VILYVDRVNISTAAPLIKADLNLTNTQLGLAFSAFAYPYALFQLIGGYFGDKFGPRLTLCVCSLIVCVATAATGVVGGLASLFGARLALGIGEGATFPTATRAMTVWIPERSWGLCAGHHPCSDNWYQTTTQGDRKFRDGRHRAGNLRHPNSCAADVRHSPPCDSRGC
jgi:MFS family permease